MLKTRLVKLLDGVTATTTSNVAYVGDAVKLLFIVTRADHSAGSSTFTFLGGISADGGTTAPTMVALNTITTNVANTNGETILRTTGAALASDTSSLLWHDCREFPLEYIQTKVTEATDGTHTCWMIVVTES